MTIVDAMGFAAFLTNVGGNLLLARRRREGWAVRILSILLWGGYALNIASVPLIANAATFLAINCYGLWKWRS